MKAIFPYSITIRPNSKYDPSECLKLIEIQECESIRSKRKYKRLKFQAIKILDNSIETYNVYGYKIVWDNIESGKLKKKIPIYFNDYNYFISTEIIYKGVWIWQVKGIHNKMKIVKDFNIVIFSIFIISSIFLLYNCFK